jgi:hypothetical protein
MEPVRKLAGEFETKWGLLSPDLHFVGFRNRGAHNILELQKEVCVRHGSVVRLLTAPDLLRHIRLKLWLRNDFPGQSVELQLSATLPSVARWWVKCRTKLPGGESLEPALCRVVRLWGHHNTFLEVGPLQPLDYPSNIWFHMVSLDLMCRRE